MVVKDALKANLAV